MDNRAPTIQTYILSKGSAGWLMGGSRIGAGLIQGGMEDSRHVISGQIARGLFGRGASGVGPAVEDGQPEPAASVAGCGQGWTGPAIGGEDQRHGPPDLRDWVHRFNASRPEGLIDNWYNRSASSRPGLRD